MPAGGGSCNCRPVRTSPLIAASRAASPVEPTSSARVILPVVSGQIRTSSRNAALRVREFFWSASSTLDCTSPAYQPHLLPPPPPPSPNKPLPPGLPTSPNASPAPSPFAFNPNGPGALS